MPIRCELVCVFVLASRIKLEYKMKRINHQYNIECLGKENAARDWEQNEYPMETKWKE